MTLDTGSITRLLNLKSHALISPDIAARQTEVIRKAYNYLTASEGRQVIYIADEVGLGKTYIALGIAMLFRHFSPGRTLCRDLVLVPKANLQDKWQDAARSFIRSNYVGNRKAEFIPQFQPELKAERLYSVIPEAAMTIFRTTSFSSLTARTSGRARLPLLKQLQDQIRHDPWALGILDKAWNNYLFESGHEKELVCLAAYLLNTLSGQINTLIVDEAHNYRHGIDAHASYRNLATSCFLGLLPRDSEKSFPDDPREKVLKQFPELKRKVHPLANKVICLSATPKDRDLWEISRQLDCFLPSHPLKGVRDVETYHKNLKSFLVRGNMSYSINGTKVSRHECRSEHRKGHVSKSKKGECLEVPDDFTGAFWQLIQYQSIKHLRAKGNISFETGMLAGFETYHLDTQKLLSPGNNIAMDREEEDVDDKKEYEQTASGIRQSEDRHVIETLVQDYQKRFDDPPHPKQTPLAKELLNQMLERQEKSLVFVRRVHTATEFAGRLLRKFEQAVADELRRFGGKTGEKPRYTRRLTDMLKEFDLKDIREDLINFFRSGKLISKIRIQKGFEWFEALSSDDERVDLCFFAYKHNEVVKANINRLRQRKTWFIDHDFWSNLEEISSLWQEERIKDNEMGGGEADDDLEGTYFFNDYFRKGRGGFRFRKKMTWGKLFELPGEPGVNDGGFLSRLLLETCSAEFAEWRDRESYQSEDWLILTEILKGIFRNGTGLLPAFVADAAESGEFADNLLLLIQPDAPFAHVAKEVGMVLRDFDLILSVNFGQVPAEKIKTYFRMLSPVVSRTGVTGADRRILAAQFRMPGFPYVLITTDIFREGEDLHTYCQNIYHYGIAWNPSDIEQRTGRIDRINSLSYRKLTDKTGDGNTLDNQVQVFYPYLKQSVEVNQVAKLFWHINKFIETFNEIDQKHERDSKVPFDMQVTQQDIPAPLKPGRGRFELEDFDGN